MSEEEFFERAINRICKDYDYNFANELKNIYLKKDKKLQQKDKEIERLNNVINNIENDLLDRYYGRGKYHLSTDIIGIPTFYRKIKELKGDDK